MTTSIQAITSTYFPNWQLKSPLICRKRHNSKGDDINEFCELTWCAVNIITKLDPAARNAYTDLWSTQSKEISDALRTEKNHKKLAHEKDNELLETIRSTLDEIPESSTSCEHTTKPRKSHQNNRMGKGKGRLRK
jgi:hypothetical protein